MLTTEKQWWLGKEKYSPDNWTSREILARTFHKHDRDERYGKNKNADKA